MSEATETLLSDHHKYWYGYIAYADIQLLGLPASINIKGEKLLKKNEFHISIINANGIAELINPKAVTKIEQEIIGEFKNFISENKLDKFRLLKKFRFVQKDIKKSVIVMCELSGAAEFFARLTEKYKKTIPLQPCHITLYTLQPEVGIGILSDEELNEISVPVNIPELENIKPG